MENVHYLNAHNLTEKLSGSHTFSKCLEKCSVSLKLLILGTQFLIPYLLTVCCTSTVCLAFCLVLVTWRFGGELLPMGLPPRGEWQCRKLAADARGAMIDVSVCGGCHRVVWGRLYWEGGIWIRSKRIVKGDEVGERRAFWSRERGTHINSWASRTVWYWAERHWSWRKVWLKGGVCFPIGSWELIICIEPWQKPISRSDG